MALLQIGMFSFWSGVALAPRLLLDRREFVCPIRKGFKLFFVSGMAVIYGVTFALTREARFLAGIGSVVFVFVLMNFFYLKYFLALRQRGQML